MEDITTFLQALPTWPWYIVAALAVWSVFWKGMGLWRAARCGDKVWFVAILLVNTVGILEILYLYVFNKKPNV